MLQVWQVLVYCRLLRALLAVRTTERDEGVWTERYYTCPAS